MLTFLRSDGFAGAQVERLTPHAYRVTGHVGGESYGADGLGHEFVGPGARERALRTAVAIAYGLRLPELGASTGETLTGMQPVLVQRRAA